MSETKWTKGPWLVNLSHIYSPDKQIIALVHNPGSKESDYPLVANRDLMAAAPELYDALEALYFHDERTPCLRDCNAYEKALAALKKARGEQ